MMRQPLLVSGLLTHAQRHHGEQLIVSRVEGDTYRYTYTELGARARRLANALRVLGIGPSDRVGTLAWNDHRHLELYYAVSGSGAVLHTLNPRLHAHQLLRVIEQADDRILFFDPSLLSTIEALGPRLESRLLVALCNRARMPAPQAASRLLCYEELLSAQSDRFVWPELDENAASSLCYTSGTTGHAKGVLYSHRSTALHAYAAALPDALNCSARSVILPVFRWFT